MNMVKEYIKAAAAVLGTIILLAVFVIGCHMAYENVVPQTQQPINKSVAQQLPANATSIIYIGNGWYEFKVNGKAYVHKIEQPTKN